MVKGLLTTTIAMCLFAVVSHDAWSQAQTIRIVVPFPAGSKGDLSARLLGRHISKVQGLSIVIENRPGGGGAIAYDAVARAASDGNALVINGNSMVIDPHLRKVNYDPITSFEPICYLVASPQVFVVNSSLPYKTMVEFIAASRHSPGRLTLATIGPATTQHLGFEQFRRLADVDVTYVPYPDGASAMTALLGGHVTAVLTNFSDAVEQLQSGNARALASASRKRIPPLPDVPTIDELGYKGYNVAVWFGVMAPARTPKAAATRLADWFRAALEAPELSAHLIKLGLYPVGTCLDGFTAHVRSQYEDYGRIIREAGIKG